MKCEVVHKKILSPGELIPIYEFRCYIDDKLTYTKEYNADHIDSLKFIFPEEMIKAAGL